MRREEPRFRVPRELEQKAVQEKFAHQETASRTIDPARRIDSLNLTPQPTARREPMKHPVAILYVFVITILMTTSLSLRSQTIDERVEGLAADTASLEEVLVLVRSEGVGRIDPDALAALKLRLVNREIPVKEDLQERTELARAWKLMSALTHQLDGDTPEVLESLRIAHNLDPEDEEVKREMDFMQRKMDAVNERLEEAARLREAKAKNN